MAKPWMRIATMVLLTSTPPGLAQCPAGEATPVTIDNYNRAQSDVYFAGAVRSGGFGKFEHSRESTPPGHKGIIRPNRDTLYSFGVFDLDAGPVTIVVPDGAPRFMSLQIINEDQFTPAVYYNAGTYILEKEALGTRYVMAVVRFLVDFSSRQEVAKVHASQDAIQVKQSDSGSFDIPNWDEAGLIKMRAALQQIGTTVTDTRHMYGASKDEVDPVRHLIGSAMLWGGNRAKDALYLPITPTHNDGNTIYKLTIGEVPVDGFWSLTVYDSKGYFDPNPDNAYSVNSLTAQKGPDGLITVQFGGCDGRTVNCLPITKGWNYTVRLFKPRPEILNGEWRFPAAQPQS
jgi:hypothetical protein